VENRKSFIESNLKTILEKLDNKAKLIAVSKTYPASDVQIAYDFGQRDFAENKVQDLLEKAQSLRENCPEIRWHFIGNIQSNKVNLLARVPNLVAVHSIDSERILKKLSQKLQGVDLFLQVNTSGESQKGGFILEEQIQKLIQNYKVHGLMTMGKIRTEQFEQEAQRCFSYLKQFRNKVDRSLKLSMGMSQDFHIALENETDFVRIGSQIFGSRN
jgi:pyridoxal phosphate enzyme (YggS family)